MGVCTIGVVATKSKDVFFVIERIEQALNGIIDPHWRAEGMGAPHDTRKFLRCRSSLNASSGSVSIYFRYEGEDRQLTVHFKCDCDNLELAPHSISMSLGYQGKSELFIKTALRGLSMLGPVYFDYSDSDSEDIALFEQEPVDFLTACAERLEYGSQFSLKDWYGMWCRGELRPGDAEEVLGIPETTIRSLLQDEYEAANRKVEALIAERASELAVA